MTANPICVSIIRGSHTESTHRGRIAIHNAKKITLKHGNTKAPIYPRSAIKIFQALPAIEAQAHKKFNFTDEEIAILGASHNGEPKHTQTVKNMLKKMNLTAKDLECGTHWPMQEKIARNLAANGKKPNALNNNCSGKHAGMLAYCLVKNIDHKGYIHPDHPVQKKIRKTIEEFCDVSLAKVPCERDGCSVPTWAYSLEKVALGFARFADADSLPKKRGDACRLLYRCIVENPFMVAGLDRYCTRAMEVSGGRVFVKVGAEGVYCGAVPEFGLGVALKCDDGAVRGAEGMMTAVLREIFEGAEVSKKFREFLDDENVMKNFNGYEVGRVRNSL